MVPMRLHLGLWLLAAAARCESNHSVIVVAGFSHTGTHLVSHALEALGLRSQVRASHAPTMDWAQFETVDAVLDHPAQGAYAEVLRRFPKSKVVLTTRDRARWLESVARTASSRPGCGDACGVPPRAVERLERYDAAVAAAAPRDRLLTLDLEAGAAYGELCAFVGVDASACAPAATTLPRNVDRERDEAPRADEAFGGVRSLLRAARRFEARSARPVSCASSLVVYPGFEALFDDVVAILDHDWRFGGELRQFLPEVFVVDRFLRHPCRAPFAPGAPGEAARSRGAIDGPPRLYFVPVPWRALSILAVGPGSRDLPHGTVRESLWARADALLRSQVLAHAYFDADRDQHVVLHTSTSAPVTVWRDHAPLMVDRRVLLPHLEGFLGDMRKGIFGVGPRTVVVPYFAEPNGLLDAALADGGPAPRSLVFLRAAAQKGAKDRAILAPAFKDVPGADVVLVERHEDKQAYEETLRTYVDTMRRMRNATFCLVPAGYTSSSRRFYESLAAGCVPVILSRHFPLPFGPSSGARRPAPWGDAVLRYAAHKVKELPAFLRALGGARVAAMRRAGAAALARVSYGNEAGEGATAALFDQLTHLVAPTTSQRLLPRDWPAAGSYLASCDGAGPASCEADKRTCLGAGGGRLALLAPGKFGRAVDAATTVVEDVEPRAPPGPRHAIGEKATALAGSARSLVGFAAALAELDAAGAPWVAVDASDAGCDATRAAAPVALGDRRLLLRRGPGPFAASPLAAAWAARCLPAGLVGAGWPAVDFSHVVGAPRALERLFAKAAVLAGTAADADCGKKPPRDLYLAAAAAALNASHPGAVGFF